MNPRMASLMPYPFTRLDELLAQTEPNPKLKPIYLSIGEPKHKPAQVAQDAIGANLDQNGFYPATKGTLELREVIADWLNKRFSLQSCPVSADAHLLPVNGTREALFAIVQLIANPDRSGGLIAMPNPFYQIYEGAALLAGKTPVFLNSEPAHQMQPNWRAVPDSVWRDTELLFICTPGNPSGTQIPLEDMIYLIEAADEHDFVIVSDECYSELYLDPRRPIPGILEACAKIGRKDFARCLAVHSLSKRSNLPGLRSGFIAGDPNLIQQFLLYRTYHGSAMPGTTQKASVAAWADETHADQNRALYQLKYAEALPLIRPHFNFVEPDAGFYLWLETPGCDRDYTQALWRDYAVKVVPGSFLARDTPTGNPGRNRIRIALVADRDQCLEGLQRLVSFQKVRAV